MFQLIYINNSHHTLKFLQCSPGLNIFQLSVRVDLSLVVEVVVKMNINLFFKLVSQLSV